jgi:hypothetical protein
MLYALHLQPSITPPFPFPAFPIPGFPDSRIPIFSGELVSKFKVDGIPHVAFITRQVEVKTALVGAVPQAILNTEIRALVQDQPLPVEGYDAFEERDHFPFGSRERLCAVPAPAPASAL